MIDPRSETTNLDAIAGAFRASVTIFERMGTPLYAELSRHCADDDAMLRLASHAPEGARPAALLSAVHYLLLGDPGDRLARYFATLTEDPLPPAGAFPELVRFASTHYNVLAELLRTRSVQTTYAERCRAILPPLCVVAREAGEPLNLIEIGCSAGVLLVFDKFAYRMNRQGIVGPADAPLLLEGELRGGPELFIPRIGRRIGIDLHTIDVRSPEQRRWLLALCFPELRHEQRQLAKALDVVAETAIELLEGDGLARLPEALASAPDPLCIFHSACLFYWPTAARAALEDMLLDASRTREFWRVGIEPSAAFDGWQKGSADVAATPPAAGKGSGVITIFHYRDGDCERRTVGQPSPDYGLIDWFG